MSTYQRNGHPMSHGSTQIRMRGRHAAFSRDTPVEGVVLKAYYPDDAESWSKKHMEYDVLEVSSQIELSHVRKLDSSGGLEDGSEVVLRETTGLVSGENPNWAKEDVDSTKLNGDRVLVQFTDGLESVPVITGVLPHPAMKYGTKKKQGRRRFMTHQGTSVEITKDGSVDVVLKDKQKLNLKTSGVELTIDGDGKKLNLTVNKSKVEMDGAVKITADAQKTVQLNGTDFHLTKGEDLLKAIATNLNNLMTALQQGTVGSPVKQQLIGLAGVTPNIMKFITELQLAVPANPYLSQKVQNG